MEDRRIVELLFARSEEAVGALREAYGPKLERLAENILGDRRDAEECVSDTLLAAWNAIPPLRPEPLLPWLYTTLRNRAINRYRQERRQKRGGGAFAAALEELGEVAAPGGGPEGEVDARELTRALDRFVGGLSKRDRRIFLGRYWYGETYQVIARRLGMTENNCMVRAARLRARLRRELEREGVL